MASKKISQFTATTSLNSGTVVPVVMDGDNYKITAPNFAVYVDGQIVALRPENNLDDVGDASVSRTNLGVAIGSDVQAYDADLSAIAALTSAANKLPYATGAQTWAMTDLSATARDVIAAANLAAMRAELAINPNSIWVHDYDQGDGDHAMWSRGIAAAVAANTVLKGLAGTYVLNGAPFSSNGLLGLESAGKVSIVCDDGFIVFQGPSTAVAQSISCAVNSDAVTGTGTTFTSMAVGDVLLTDDSEYIGTIGTINSNTSITLTADAWVTHTGTYRWSSEERAIFSFTTGADCYFDNVELDAGAIASNFGLKATAAGDFTGGHIRFRYKSPRWVGDCGAFDVARAECIDIQGHAMTSGAGPGATYGTNLGGYIGEVIVENCTKSAFNFSTTRSTGQLFIGRVKGIWSRWEDYGIPYPTQYATIRLGNGAANITIDNVYGEGMFRLVRLTDTDNCWVNNANFKNILGPVVLFNSKDQVAENSGVRNVSGTGPNRGNGRPLPSDDDGESISNPNEEAIVIAEGVAWTVGQVTISSDEYILGLGTITATSGVSTIVNYDTVVRGQDINCFDDLTVGDFLFNTSEQLLGKVTAIGLKSYWADSGSTVPLGTAGSGTVSTSGTTLTKVGGTSFAAQGVAAGDYIINSLGNVVGVVDSITSADILELEAAAAIAMAPGSAWYHVGSLTGADNATQTATLSGGSLQTVAGGSEYYQRTPDPYFYTGGGGLATTSGTSMTIPLPTVGAGAISTVLASTTVTGNGSALFQTNLSVGQHLFTAGNVSIGQIESIESQASLTLVDPVEASGVVTTAAYGVGYNFNDVLVAGDAIFDASDNLVGEISSITDYRTIVLANNDIEVLTNEAFQFGRWKKTARGVEIAATAVNTNINLADVWVQGAVAQYRLQTPSGIRPTNNTTILEAQLATIDAADRRGEAWEVSNGNGSGRFISDGTDWVRTNTDRLRRDSSTVDDFTLDYLDNQPNLQLHGALPAGTSKTITLPTVGVPDGAIFTITCTSAVLGTWSVAGLAYITGGQSATVVYDKSAAGAWRLLMTAAAAQRPAKVGRGSGAPESSVAGNIGDLYVNLAGSAGATAYVKESGAGTTTGWIPLVTTSGGAALAIPAGTVSAPGLYFTGDSNTGMWSPAADTIAWSEGGAEAMRLTSAGRLGIGTTTPNNTLQVAGLINFDTTLRNTFIGSSAGSLAAAATMDSVGIGQSALLNSNTTNARNTAVGYQSGRSMTTGNNNTALGYMTLDGNVDGAYNVAIGPRALEDATTGSYNIAIGGLALYDAETPASNSIAIGYNTLPVTTAGNQVAIGHQALSANTTGTTNTAVGYLAMLTNSTGANNVGLGSQALRYTDGGTNVAVGSAAGRGTSGTQVCEGNVYIGNRAGEAIQTGADYNVAVGYLGGLGITTGQRNVLIGPSVVSSSYNQVTTGSRNVAIGNDVAVPTATANDQLCISNFIYGTSMTGTGATVSSSGLLGLGTKTPAGKLHVYTSASTATVNTSADDLVVEHASTGGISILTPDTTGVANIFFGHNNDNDAGRIVYTNNGDTMGFFTNGTIAVTISSTGAVGIGNTTFAQKLDVTGAIKTTAYTVATLPAGQAGARAFVTDATASTFASIVAGGGAIGVPVYHDGTNWCVG